MIPPHERPWLDELTDHVLSRPCWCDAQALTFIWDTDEEGRAYIYPRRWHRDDEAMPMRHANAIGGQPPA
jgi:hypothetical protein